MSNNDLTELREEIQNMGGVKRIFRDTFKFSSGDAVITLPYTVNPDKCDVTLYGNGYSNSGGTDNHGISVVSLTSTKLTVHWVSATSSPSGNPYGNCQYSYQIVEYN